MKLYENVAIGNFLYGLGFAIGKRIENESFPSIVNLLQQTPDDPALGDLLFKAPGMLRVFEFKLRENLEGQVKEAERHKKLKTRLDETFPELIPVSREVHWYIEIDTSKDDFVASIVSYIDAFPQKAGKGDTGLFAAFIQKTADAAVLGVSNSESEAMNHYLAVLATLHKDGVNSGGLIVKMSPDGTLHYADMVSVIELVLTREQIAAYRQEREIQAKQEYEKQLNRNMGRDRGR